MTEPRRWADAPALVPEEARAAEVVKVAATIPPRPVHLGDWEEVLLKGTRPSRAWPALATVAVAMLVAVALGLGWQRYTAPRLSASPEAKVVMGDDGVDLSWGRLELTTKAPIKLTTPHLTSLIVNGRVAAEVDLNTTRLTVYEGLISGRVGNEVVELHPGQSREWPPAPVLPPSLLASTPPAPGACDERPEGERSDCLVAESSGAGLTAQLALYRRASLAGLEPEAAQLLWRESLQRFPSGVLHPEVRLNLIRSLLVARQFDAAVTEALAFEQACPSDPRLADVRELRRGLEPGQ